MELIYQDKDIVVCVKPARVLSTDEPGGMPELVRQALGIKDVRTVHRLDRVVSGLMVMALSAKAASELSRQIREDQFEKEYLAVVHGTPEQDEGRLQDLLLRDKARKMTLVTQEPGKGVQPASLRYRVLNRANGMSRVRVALETGRTHQIRVQFASRGMPLVGERKYSTLADDCEIALWSYRLAFTHPNTGKPMEFTLEPPQVYPWTDC
ncbi:MAG: RluA family pseudouridine synthase [Oscillospiraceae bacterium]|nr:RluA family pseudouridine synthase [Oscillospiraceae bacterium]